MEVFGKAVEAQAAILKADEYEVDELMRLFSDA